MEPLRLVIENFMIHRFTDIDCTSFNSAIIIAKDKNDDNFSNGAGKSTIFKAIEYVLFGEYEVKIIDKIVRRGCSRARVTFDFKLSNQIFRVQRTRTRNNKSGKSELLMWEKVGDTWSSLGQKTSSQLEIELAKLIKINYKAFRNSVLFARGDIEGLSSTKSPEKRKEILKEALNLIDYSKLEKIVKEDISETNKKILVQKTVISSLGDPEKEISEIKSKLEISENSLIEKGKEEKELRIFLSEKRVILTELQKTLNSDAGLVQEKLSAIGLAKKQLQLNIDNSKKILLEKEKHLSQSNLQLNENEKSLKELQQQLATLQANPNKNIETIKKELELISTNESNGNSYIFSIENEIKKLTKPLPDGDNCPHCRQKMSQEHKEECLKNIETELESSNKKLTESKKRLEIIKLKKNKLKFELEEEINLKSSKSNFEFKIENKETEVKHNAEFVKHLSELISHIKDELNGYKSTLSDTLAQEASLEETAKMLDIDTINLKISQTKKDIDANDKKSQALSEEISSTKTQIGILSEKLNSKQKDKAKLRSFFLDLEKLEKTHQIQQLCAKSFGSGGIPTMIIYTILDDLQIESNKLLNELRPGFELQFSVVKNNSDGEQEDTLFLSYRLHGVEFDYEELSDGQKLMVSLSLRIGLSLVIQHRLGTDIKFLELDEVDEKLDKAAVNSFAQIIKRLQDKFKIFVITHNDVLKDKFSHAILVEHDEHNGSSGKVVSSW